MAQYIPQSTLHLARLLYVRPETFRPYYVLFPHSNQIWSFSTDFCEGPQTSYFTSMRPVGAAMIHANREIDRETNGRTWRCSSVFFEPMQTRLMKHAIIKYFVTTAECYFTNGAQNLASTLLWTRFYHLSPRRFAVSGQTRLTTWTKYRCGIKAQFDG